MVIVGLVSPSVLTKPYWKLFFLFFGKMRPSIAGRGATATAGREAQKFFSFGGI